ALWGRVPVPETLGVFESPLWRGAPPPPPPETRRRQRGRKILFGGLHGRGGRGLAFGTPIRSSLECDENSRADAHLARSDPRFAHLVEHALAEEMRAAERRDRENSRRNRRAADRHRLPATARTRLAAPPGLDHRPHRLNDR